MGIHSDNPNTLNYTAPDGSYQEAVLDRLTDIQANTGGASTSIDVNKFGFNTDIDTATSEIIASFGGAFDPLVNIMTTAQTFTIAYNNTTDGSGQAGATMLQFSYIDENAEAQTAIHVLGSTGSDVTSFTGLGINRVVVVAFGSNSSNGNDITITATTDTTIQAQIPAGKSVTQQCIYHTPINRTLKISQMIISALKVSGGGGSPVVNIIGYSFSRVTLGAYAVFDIEVDTQIENNIDLEYNVPITFTGREVIYFIASTNVNNTKISMRFAGQEDDS